MIKGVGKQVVVLSTPDSKLYEQAIFILKQAPSGACDTDMLAEAEKIINSHIFTAAMRSPRARRARFRLILAITVGAVLLVGATVLIFALL